jgi:predicted phage terminase large subunit-like protein
LINKLAPITDEDIKWLMDNPVEAKVVLLGDFCRFVRVFHWYMNRAQFDIQPFHHEIAKKFVSYMKGTNEKQNLYIGISPRSGKSQLVIYFNAFAYGANPFSNFIYTSYSNDLCIKHSKKIRDVVESPLFQRVFGLTIDQNTSAGNLWKIAGGGEFRSVAMGGAITGFGAGTFANQFGGAIIVDDFLKADDYKSKAEKQNTIDIFENTLRSRKNRPAKDPTIIIAQRLAKDDLIDYIKEKYPDEWDFFVIPALNEETGESFWEERYPAQMLLRMKEENPFLFYSQYQQAPIAMGGGVIKREWWQFYRDIEDTRYRKMYITADTAIKTKEWNDFTAIGCWGLTIGNKLRLLDMVHGKFEIPELQATMLAFWEKWRDGIGNCRCTEIIIEDKASGMQLIQQLRRIGGLPIRPVTPEKDKLSRVYDVIPQIASGNVELPESENNKISREFLAESDAFSADGTYSHDDMIDMAVYAIDKAFTKHGYF